MIFTRQKRPSLPRDGKTSDSKTKQTTKQSAFIVIASIRACSGQSRKNFNIASGLLRALRALATTMLLFSTLGISLTGCTTCANAVPHNEPTMAEIYEQAMQQSHQSTLEQARTQVKNIACDETGTSRCASTKIDEMKNLFPTLPNPQLILYVYPHLSHPDEAPVPGYRTAFSLYEKIYYAVEGEVRPMSF